MNSDLDIICGTRPQLIKATWIRQRAKERGLTVRVIHMGQHYSPELITHEDSKPDLYLPITRDESSSDAGVAWGVQQALEEIDYNSSALHGVMLIGDCSTTLGAALYLTRMGYQFSHLEAGTRSSESLIEGIIRYAVDQLADLNLCPTASALANIEREEGRGVYTGDVLLDRWLHYSNTSHLAEYWTDGSEGPGTYITKQDIIRVPDVIVSLHRHQTVDYQGSLDEAFSMIDSLAVELKDTDLTMGVVFHPRLLNQKRRYGITLWPSVKEFGALPYEIMNTFVREAMLVITDSGGLQREAFWAGTNCIVYREATEWPEILGSDSVLLTTDSTKIMEAYGSLREGYPLNPEGAFLLPEERYALFGGTHVVDKVLEALK